MPVPAFANTRLPATSTPLETSMPVALLRTSLSRISALPLAEMPTSPEPDWPNTVLPRTSVLLPAVDADRGIVEDACCPDTISAVRRRVALPFTCTP